MEYTATVDFSTTMSDEDILTAISVYHGSLAESFNGYRAICSFEADSLSDAAIKAQTIGAELGSPFALSVAPSSMVDGDTARGELPPLVSVTEAAELLGITPQGVNKKLNSGSLPGAKIGNTWVIPLHAVASVL